MSRPSSSQQAAGVWAGTPPAPTPATSVPSSASVSATGAQPSMLLRMLHSPGFVDGAGGWICGVAQVATGHPLDTIVSKVRMQLQSADRPLYTSMRHCAVTVWRNEGIRGLFKGAPAPALGATTLNAVLFGTYGQAQRLFVAPTPTRPHVRPSDLTLPQIWCCGFIAGSCVASVECPDDLLKVKVQAQVGKASALTPGGGYTGVFDCARQILRNYGIRGMYQGYGATVLRNAPGCANSLCVYEGSMRLLGGSSSPSSSSSSSVNSGPISGPESAAAARDEAPLAVSAVSGALAGLGFWLFTYPLEMIKTRLQADHSDPAQRRYGSWLQCARATYAEQGVRGMYRGFVPCQMRGVVVNASVFVTLEAWHRAMRQQQQAWPIHHVPQVL